MGVFGDKSIGGTYDYFGDSFPLSGCVGQRYNPPDPHYADPRKAHRPGGLTVSPVELSSSQPTSAAATLMRDGPSGPGVEGIVQRGKE